MAINMKYSIIIIMLLLSAQTTAGNLYTFDESSVRKAALNWILSRHHKFTYTKLKHKYSISSINKNGKLIVSVLFSYTSNSYNNLSYVCASIDENGVLVNLVDNIESHKTKFGKLRPINFSCAYKSHNKALK